MTEDFDDDILRKISENISRDLDTMIATTLYGNGPSSDAKPLTMATLQTVFPLRQMDIRTSLGRHGASGNNHSNSTERK
jgi:hypothetical protein